MSPRSGHRLRALVVALGLVGLAPAGTSAQVDETSASIQGRVREHESGAPLEGAYVTLMPFGEAGIPSRTLITDPSGRFRFAALRAGFYIISARLLGYRELVDTIQVAPNSFTEAMLPLSVSAVELEPVMVVVQRRPIGPLQGFERRRETQSGLFLTRDVIEEQAPQEFSDLLRSVGGVRLVPTSTLGYRVRFREGCRPDLWLDGTLMGSTADIDDFVNPDHLEAVEIYRGTELPGEFGSNLCGAIVAWTRRGGPAEDERSIPLQLLYAAGFALLVLISRGT